MYCPFPCLIALSLSRATLECKRGASAGNCSEVRGQAKTTLPPAWCFKQLPPAGRGCVENMRGNTEKGEKAQKGREKKYSREAQDKLQVVDYFSPRL